MTDNQINAAIAEALGWRVEDGVYMWTEHGIDKTAPLSMWDWCNDLNAMHEAEGMLTEDQFKMYTHWLEKLMPDTRYRSLLCAPASRRAEAFLRVMGKWEEVAK